MFLSRATAELNLRVVYYGPPGVGIAETLQFIYSKTAPETKSPMVTFKRESERRTFFAFTPQNLGQVQGFNVRFNLHGLSGEAFSDEALREILRDLDGVVFVADGRRERMSANLESLRRLNSDLIKSGWEPKHVPLVVQIDRSGGGIQLPSSEVLEKLELPGRQGFDVNLSDGVGAFDVLKAIARYTLRAVTERNSKETRQTAAERLKIYSYVASSRLRSHMNKHFGENRKDFDPPSLSEKLPQYQMLVYSPSDQRNYYTYTTTGLSALPQETQKATPRIEIIAYSPTRNDSLIGAVGKIGEKVLEASESGREPAAFDVVSISDAKPQQSRFLLVPAPETSSFLDFRDVLYSAICAGDDKVAISGFFWNGMPFATDLDFDPNSAVVVLPRFLQAIPITADESMFAVKQGGKALFDKLDPARRGRVADRAPFAR